MLHLNDIAKDSKQLYTSSVLLEHISNWLYWTPAFVNCKQPRTVLKENVCQLRNIKTQCHFWKVIANIW